MTYAGPSVSPELVYTRRVLQGFRTLVVAPIRKRSILIRRRIMTTGVVWISSLLVWMRSPATLMRWPIPMTEPAIMPLQAMIVKAVVSLILITTGFAMLLKSMDVRTRPPVTMMRMRQIQTVRANTPMKNTTAMATALWILMATGYAIHSN